jgi:single-stranded-DNA-specific exonuclease
MAAGGHAMAAGFTVETSKLEELTKVLSQVKISEDLLVKKTRVDAQIPISDVNYALFNKLKQFEPFGSGNPKPIFESRNVVIDDIKKVGKLQQHSKLTINGLEAMAFNQPDIPPSPVNIVYSLDENTWNGHTKLQLVVKDIQPI